MVPGAYAIFTSLSENVQKGLFGPRIASSALRMRQVFCPLKLECEIGIDPLIRRKRHALVDTMGLLLWVFVSPADVGERAGAAAFLPKALRWFRWLR